MFKKIVAFITMFMLIFAPVTASAASFGHSSIGYHSSRSYSGSTARSYSSTGGYRSGYQSPSSRVNRSYNNPGFGTGLGSRFGGWGSHLFSFGAGWFLGSMFHPFGGYWGGMGYHGFSFFGILFDLLILYIIFRIVRGIFRRR